MCGVNIVDFFYAINLSEMYNRTLGDHRKPWGAARLGVCYKPSPSL